MPTPTQIPVRNIFYLLSYAWDAYATDGLADIEPERCPDLANLFAVILANGLHRLIKRDGLYRAYDPKEDELTALRGKLRLTAGLKRQIHQRGRAVCVFDELSHDVVLNQILRSTLDLLLAAADLEEPNRQELLDCRKWLADITPIPLKASLFRRLQFSGNTSRYRFLIRLCELIFGSLLPTEKDGKTRFQHFFHDEARMHAIFERFVLNFATRHAKSAKVRAMTIQWVGAALSEEARCMLPGMRTDVTIEYRDRKLVLDCKYYREALLSYRGGEKLNSAHLYQLFAYLQNKAVEPGWEKCEGMLLYPTVKRAFDCRYNLSGHPVRVATIDLAKPWREIHNTLLAYIA